MNLTGSTFNSNFGNVDPLGRTGGYTAIPPMTTLSYGVENKPLNTLSGPQVAYQPHTYKQNTAYTPATGTYHTNTPYIPTTGMYKDFRPRPEIHSHEMNYGTMRSADHFHSIQKGRMTDMEHHSNVNQQAIFDKDATIRNQAKLIDEMTHRVRELEEKLIFSNTLEKELTDIRIRHEREMTENANIIDRLKRSLDDAARHRPSLDERPYYDARTVDILTGGPPKTEIIYKTDPYIEEQLEMYKRHNIQVLEENNLLKLKV